ncbi:MAG: PKD repeat protein [Rhodothermales bacterium]|jgi:PKD repeat protein
MHCLLRSYARVVLFLLLFVTSLETQAGDTDPNVSWPLCGRIAASPPAGWVDTDGCPADRFGDAGFSDEPLSATFGPRPLASENNRYDFHRGVDIATPIGTPFFAISDGRVDIAGDHTSYSDPLVKLRHFRPGETSCSPTGCYYSFYLHISNWVVIQNEQVVKGQLLGYTGASGSGFEHVHFEVRDAPDTDVLSAWSRDAVHPLSVVPYAAANNTAIVFNEVDFTVPNSGSVDLTLTSNRFDLVYVGLSLFDANQQPLAQSGSTPDANGFHLLPPFFDMEHLNFMYSHKDSTAIPWESFGTGGANQCPYHADHGASYNPGLHMDAQDPVDFHDGLFNGLHIRTQKYWPSDVDDYEVNVEFTALEGVASCVQATALFASGDSAISEWGSCSALPNQPPVAAMTWSCQGFDCSFDGGPSSDVDGTVISYDWDFGDGTFGTGATPNHSYASAGSRQVTLTVTDDDAAANNVDETVSVTEPLLVRGPYLQMQTDDGVTIHWRTDTATDSVVRYGDAPGNLTNTVTDPASVVDHAVVLGGLGANQQYWYSVGDSIAPIGGDASYHFTTAPPQGFAADTRIWAIGDSGTADANARAVRDAYKAWSVSNPADIWLMLGDNAYNDGTDAEYQAAVFDTYPEILRQVPLWSTLGNHDGHTADSTTQTGPYYDIFNLPKNAEIGGLLSGTEAYYSFDYANIHFVCLDSYETSAAPGDAMMTWLENDLALNTQPWVIAYWHHPPYTKGSHNSDTEGQLIDMREIALPILEDWGVDFVMSGHSHSYERSYLLDGHYGISTTLDPVANVLNPGDGNETGDGVYQKPDSIAAARAGAVYSVAGSSGKTSNAALDHPAMLVNLVSLGSLVVDVSGSRMDVFFLDETGAVQDEFTILKTPDIEPPLISAANTEDATHVIVDFNEALDLLEAATVGNYSVPGLSVSQTELLANGRSVRLTTSVMTPETNYTLFVSNVEDLAGNIILPNSQISFDFFDIMTASFQDGLEPNPAYDGTQDAYIREFSATTPHGLETTLQVDGSEPSGSTTDMNIVLGWDISSIPSNAVVQTAGIQLQVTNASSGSYICNSLLNAWDQSQVTWNEASTGVAWDTPGASSASDRGSETVCTVNAGSTGTLAVSLINDGLTLVQSWVANPGNNNGIIISGPNVGDGADFHSSESGTAVARPRLTVTYSVPISPGIDPVASFTFSCTELACDFTDTSSDSDGTVDQWSWNFGGDGASTAQNPSHTFSGAGDYTVSLTVTDDDGLTNGTNSLVSVAVAPAFVDQFALADLPASGTVTGNFSDTDTDDGNVQSITERESGGRKSSRHSFLEHVWQFSVAPGSSVSLNANVWSSGSSEGDEFVFAWSDDNSNFADLFTVSNTTSNNLESAFIPSSGTIYVRVMDTDQTQGNNVLDTVFIDQLYIRSENGVIPEPPAAPTGLAANGVGSESIGLTWSHPTEDETSFDLERSLSGSGPWVQIASPAGGSSAYSDGGVSAATSYFYRILARNSGGASGYSNLASGTTDPAPSSVLSAVGNIKKGKHEVNLTWSGASGSSVDVIRDSSVLASTNNNGRYTDKTGNSGSRTYIYQICETGTSTCSNEVVVVY